MEAVVIQATDLRVRMREIMERVKHKGEVILITTFGQPTAMIISVDEYNLLQREIKDLKEELAGNRLLAPVDQKTT